MMKRWGKGRSKGGYPTMYGGDVVVCWLVVCTIKKQIVYVSSIGVNRESYCLGG